MFRSSKPKPKFANISSKAIIEKDVEIGTWSVVEADALIGKGTKLGPWSTVGRGSIIGRNVQFGNWAKIGQNAVVGHNVTLGSHTIVADGASVPSGAILGNNDLVTPDGIIENRTGGFSMSVDRDQVRISGPFGKFAIPRAFFPGSEDNASDAASLMIEEYQFGRTQELDAYRITEELELPSP